jgi:hypothetical protein
LELGREGNITRCRSRSSSRWSCPSRRQP